MPVIFITLIAILTVTLALLLSGNLRMDPRGAALGMMSGGLGLIAFAVVSRIATGEALTVAPAVLGVLFIAVGARRLRTVR